MPLITEAICRFSRLRVTNRKAFCQDCQPAEPLPSAQIILPSTLRVWNPCLQVKGLQFNPQSPHLLASAGADGELAIWDLTDPRQPKQYPPLKVNYHCRITIPSVLAFLACMQYDIAVQRQQLVLGTAPQQEAPSKRIHASHAVCLRIKTCLVRTPA